MPSEVSNGNATLPRTVACRNARREDRFVFIRLLLPQIYYQTYANLTALPID
jgi:hypothetical protein